MITKVSEEFYSAKTYASNNEQVSSKFSTRLTPLTNSQLIHKSYEVLPESVEFNPSVIYSDSVVRID